MRKTVTWTPDPDTGAAPLAFKSDAGPWLLVDIQGHTGSDLTPSGVTAPRQVGATPTGVVLPPGVITLTIGLIAETETDLEAMRRTLEHVFADEPPGFGSLPKVGRLRYKAADAQSRDIDAMPLGAPKIVSTDPTMTMQVFDVEVWCPDPRWRSTGDILFSISETSSGGFEFPLEMPFEMISFNAATILVNSGDLSAPILARLYGEVTNPSLVNDRTGEVIRIEGVIAADEYIEVDTSFGHKSVTHVDSAGVRTNALGWLDLDGSVLWSLLPGSQGVEFQADSNVSGSADVRFRPRFRGV